MERNMEDLNRVGMGEWEEIEMFVDSGATETVLGEGMLHSVETRDGLARGRGWSMRRRMGR